MTKPKSIQLSSKDQADLVERIKTATLTENGKEILTGLIEFNNWLQFSLQEKSISINRLQKIFGINSEKRHREHTTKLESSTKGINKSLFYSTPKSFLKTISTLGFTHGLNAIALIYGAI